MVTLDSRLRVMTQSREEAQFQYDEIFRHGCYDIPLSDDAFVVDVGANIGIFTLFIKQRYPRARVLAFEPIPDSVVAFEHNIRLHQLSGVEIQPCAVGARRQSNVEFTYYPSLPGNSTRYPEQKALQIAVLARDDARLDVTTEYRGVRVTAEVWPLSAVLPKSVTVDLLKIDVEGAELEVLQGIEEGDWPRIKRIVTEVQDLDDRLASVERILRDQGYVTAVEPSPMVEHEILTFLVSAIRPASPTTN